MNFHPPLRISTTIARWGLAGLLWLLRRPFLLSRRLWICALLAAMLLDAAAWIPASLLVSLILLAPPLVCAAVLLQWWWLGRGSHPIVFLCLVKGRSRVGRQAAETHLGALETYLRESEHMQVVGPLDIRVIGLPLSEAQAERLLRISNALVVVRGTGDAAAETSRREWWAHFRDQTPEFDLSERRFSLSNVDSSPSLLHGLLSVPPVATSHDMEGDLEVTEFVADAITIGHFDALSEVIGISSEVVFERPTRRGTFLIPEPDEPGLTPGLQGRGAGGIAPLPPDRRLLPRARRARPRPHVLPRGASQELLLGARHPAGARPSQLPAAPPRRTRRLARPHLGPAAPLSTTRAAGPADLAQAAPRGPLARSLPGSPCSSRRKPRGRPGLVGPRRPLRGDQQADPHPRHDRGRLPRRSSPCRGRVEFVSRWLIRPRQ